MRILVVEDEAKVVRFLRQALEVESQGTLILGCLKEP